MTREAIRREDGRMAYFYAFDDETAEPIAKVETSTGAEGSEEQS